MPHVSNRLVHSQGFHELQKLLGVLQRKNQKCWDVQESYEESSLSLNDDDGDNNNNNNNNNMIQTRQYVYRIMFSTLGECNIYFSNVALQVVYSTRLDFCPLHPPWNVQEESFNGTLNLLS